MKLEDGTEWDVIAPSMNSSQMLGRKVVKVMNPYDHVTITQSDPGFIIYGQNESFKLDFDETGISFRDVTWSANYNNESTAIIWSGNGTEKIIASPRIRERMKLTAKTRADDGSEHE